MAACVGLVKCIMFANCVRLTHVCACVFVCVCVGPGDNVPVVYALDVTDASKWEETVLNPALQILDSLSKVGPR